ncbi:MAG: hypothetical protein ACOC2L_00185 [Candidatus Sumerlaeota bacterium]
MNPENPKPVFHSREQNENTRLQEDLRQHQAELEMQNEELRKSQENIEKVQQAYRDLYENARSAISPSIKREPLFVPT